jgi:acetylornithine/succinyldiaminopimelate/putrescine aminotransferase
VLEDVAAIFIEPILGEGGVRPLPAEFVDWLKKVQSETEIPIVADEIQTGFYRTGTFLASQQMGLVPDYICMSKALGGGLAKIGALLIRRERFVEEFSIKHSSTFAEDDRGWAGSARGGDRQICHHAAQGSPKPLPHDH